MTCIWMLSLTRPPPTALCECIGMYSGLCRFMKPDLLVVCNNGRLLCWEWAVGRRKGQLPSSWTRALPTTLIWVCPSSVHTGWKDWHDIHYSYLLYNRTHFFQTQTSITTKQLRSPLPHWTGHTYILYLHLYWTMLALINTIAILTILCLFSRCIAVVLKCSPLRWIVHLHSFRGNQQRVALKNKKRIYIQQSTYRDLMLMDEYLTHNTQPHTKHTRAHVQKMQHRAQ